MEISTFDQYAAFDFFVTAEHIVDWRYPANKSAREKLRASSPLLRITSHLANGSKHFEATANHHRSVARTEKSRYIEKGYIKPGYFHEPLFVHLTPDEAHELGTPILEAVALARQVLEFWIKYGNTK